MKRAHLLKSGLSLEKSLFGVGLMGFLTQICLRLLRALTNSWVFQLGLVLVLWIF